MLAQIQCKWIISNVATFEMLKVEEKKPKRILVIIPNNDS